MTPKVARLGGQIGFFQAKGRHELVITAMPHLVPLTALATVALTACLVAIAWIDAHSLLIPDRLSLPLIGLGLCWAALQPDAPVVPHLIGAALGYGILAIIGSAYFHRTGTEGLGLGDAKLFAAAGAWLGWQALPQVLLIAATTGLIFALIRKSQRASGSVQLAFGPWLALGMWLVWIWQEVLPLA